MEPIDRHTYRLELAYDGASFWGYAAQPGLPTVEGALRTAILPLLPQKQRHLDIRVGGRTDRGVHAVGQVISFCALASIDARTLATSIEAEGGGAIAVLGVRDVHHKFHAQFSAIARHYTYILPDGDTDAARVDRLLAELVGSRCFSAFARDTPPGKSTIRTLHRATARRVRYEDTDALRFDFTGAAFLRHQVRIMVSTAVREARAMAPAQRLVELAILGDRRATAPAAPAEHLTLVRISY
jgi:tRNA pseudouridine38-40 synthase